MFWMYNNKIIRLFKSPGVYTGRGGGTLKESLGSDVLTRPSNPDPIHN